MSAVIEDGPMTQRTQISGWLKRHDCVHECFLVGVFVGAWWRGVVLPPDSALPVFLDV